MKRSDYVMCDKDCFNCKFNDCIRDEGADNRDNYNRYRKANHDKEIERDRARYINEKDRRKQNSAKWREEHKKERKEYFRKRYLEKKRSGIDVN